MKPEPTSNLDAALRELERWLEQERHERKVPGWSVALVGPERPLLLLGAGEAFRGKLATPATLFQIGSLTKVFTACAVLRCRDEGHFHLDQPVSDVLPEFRPKNPFPHTRPPTFRQVLSHTAGLPYHFDTSQWTATTIPTPSELLQELSTLTLVYPPLTRFKYSNVGSFVLGEVVRRLRGDSIDAVIERELLAPLGMKKSGFFLHARDPNRNDLAVGHALAEDGTPHPFPHFETPTFAAASELYSSAEELARFLLWQSHEGDADHAHPLGVSTLREMHAPVFLSETGHEGTALGWRMGRVAGHQEIHHGGGMPGQISFVRCLPRLGLAVAMLANTNTDPESLTRSLLERFVPVWEEELDLAELGRSGLSKSNLEEFVGHYEAPGFRKYRFVLRGLKLIATVPGSPESEWFRLRPRTADRFLMEGGPSDGEEVQIVRDQGGALVQLASSSHAFVKIP